ARIEEQVAVLRALWCDPVITFEGKWHKITEAGINPLPIQRPIPIWFGAGGPLPGVPDVVLNRIGRLGDGWFPMRRPDDKARAMIDQVHVAARVAGRDPASIGLAPRLATAQVPEAEWTTYAEGWRGLGATHLGVVTMNAGLRSAQDHIDILRRVKERLDG
ncbi:MAG TPA: LLM class flavin-dependent oxidoreductase, partial [Dehalococcoidia bacterium]|nr:LLM class flavin-dependent oxidoreductase [Dehalococcoidia bacterium]